ncbi:MULTISPECIES: spore germination protein [Paenibacillus]|uniref:spore germination protein n=1 Tax=Paenibacillus TaxID=44249 RepID=UPI0022B8E843|nr:spore germination protein [Paenibacillus caseinilyticus]MCZ8519126.1 spore germination protein [Paenibacillus caseinilyticus]
MITEPWNKERLEALFGRCQDVQSHRLPGEEGVLLYCEGLAGFERIAENLSAGLEERIREDRRGLPLPVERLSPGITGDALADRIFSGKALLYFDASGALYSVDCADRPERTPQESTTEPTNYGPKDGFIEQLTVNVALIRKRLKTEKLACEQLTIGTRSKNRVALLYMEDLLEESTLLQVRERLHSIDTEALMTNEELKALLQRPGFSFLPMMYITTRPDMAVESLMNGRFVLLMDGIPNVLIAPVNLSFLMTGAEDAHMPPAFNYVSILMRRFGFVVTLLLPGFWTALTTYHQDQIPFSLLATISVQNMGTPISGPLELMLMMFMFHLFFEAGIRLPSTLGPSISVVGGLIIGDAIIDAGLSSPASLVVAAVTSISQFVLSGGLFGVGMGLIRIYIFLLSAVFGLFGFFTGAFSVLVYLANLRSFGVPFLTPFSPPVWKDLRFVFTRMPRGEERRRPEALKYKVPSKRDGVGEGQG